MAKFLVKPTPCEIQKEIFSPFDHFQGRSGEINSPSAFRISPSLPQKPGKTQMQISHSFKIDDILKSNKIINDEADEKCSSTSFSSSSSISSYSPSYNSNIPVNNDIITSTNFQIQLMNLASFYQPTEVNFPFHTQASSLPLPPPPPQSAVSQISAPQANPFNIDIFKSLPTDLLPMSRLESSEMSTKISIVDHFAKKIDALNESHPSKLPITTSTEKSDEKKNKKKKETTVVKPNKKKKEKKNDECGCNDLACRKSSNLTFLKITFCLTLKML